jgi:hypothetical protein
MRTSLRPAACRTHQDSAPRHKEFIKIDARSHDLGDPEHRRDDPLGQTPKLSGIAKSGGASLPRVARRGHEPLRALGPAARLGFEFDRRIAHVAADLGVPTQALRRYARQVEANEDRRRTFRLRRANEILKPTSLSLPFRYTTRSQIHTDLEEKLFYLFARKYCAGGGQNGRQLHAQPQERIRAGRSVDVSRASGRGNAIAGGAEAATAPLGTRNLGRRNLPKTAPSRRSADPRFASSRWPFPAKLQPYCNHEVAQNRQFAGISSKRDTGIESGSGGEPG